jgi:N-acetylneuraminate synthase
MSLDLIVEIGNSHEGSLGIATSFVDMVADTGAKTVKFQMHLPKYESSSEEPFRKQFSFQDKTRVEYWNRVGFSHEEWKHLIDHVQKNNLEFMCSPFSIEAAEWLLADGRIKRWKVGSGEATNFPLLDFMIESKLPIILSTGLVNWNEILEIKERFETTKSWGRVTLMHCVSMYPTLLQDSSLNIIEELQTLDCNVGLSDHSGNLAVPLLAYAKGASTIEVHMTPHKKFFGPDTVASLTLDEIKNLVQTCDSWDILNSNKGSRDTLFNLSQSTAKIFRKGIYWKNNLPKGHVIKMHDLSFLKPSSYFEAKNYETILGKVTADQVYAGNPILPEELK